MIQLWYNLLNIFFLCFHGIFIIFILLGLWFKKTRKIHLMASLLILFSWVGLGYFYGFGYCFCTEWHWRVREKLGDHPTSESYVKFLVDEIFQIDSDPLLIDHMTVGLFVLALFISIVLNILDLKKRKN